MEFDELLGMLDGMESLEGRGAVRESLIKYNDEMSEGANAKISELESALDEMSRKYQDTAARNYELMRAVTAPAGEPKEGEDNDLAGEPTEDDKDVSKLIKGGR